MSDDEFDLMDELYFVQPYVHLKEQLGWEDEKLLSTLQLLYQKEWIKCLYQPDEEIFSDARILQDGKAYYYLASKKGLMEHNAL
ncbi:hypothetical protein [Pararhodonellum marinum]|uniref:hypothetical protein n=1 Tax=Pararhodonellum marinum TaxID=2755358 RepID=UPI00188FDFEB|nr:hypothetical protein [Pararhodonellum marinum]